MFQIRFFLNKELPTFLKVFLKTLDTIGNCKRLAFAVASAFWCFWSLAVKHNVLLEHPCHTKLYVFRCLISKPQILNLRSRNQIRGNFILSRKLHYFRGNLFSRCFYTIHLSPLLVTKKGVIII